MKHIIIHILNSDHIISHTIQLTALPTNSSDRVFQSNNTWLTRNLFLKFLPYWPVNCCVIFRFSSIVSLQVLITIEYQMHRPYVDLQRIWFELPNSLLFNRLREYLDRNGRWNRYHFECQRIDETTIPMMIESKCGRWANINFNISFDCCGWDIALCAPWNIYDWIQIKCKTIVFIRLSNLIIVQIKWLRSINFENHIIYSAYSSFFFADIFDNNKFWYLN